MAFPRTLHVAPLVAALCTAVIGGADAQQVQQPRQGELAPSRADAQTGQPYTLGTFEDWNVRCVRVESGQPDPCEMNQLLSTQDGNPTAEINLFPIDRDGVPAGATVITPLQTLLTENLSMTIDAGQTKTYPFRLCTRQGCVVQLGLTADEVARMKAGTQAVISIVPAAAPDQQVDLTVSLAGFTAAFAMLDAPDLP